MSVSSNQQAGRRAISATEEEIIALLDRLDAQDGDSDGGNPKPKADSFEYRIDSCEVALRHIGATNEVVFIVPTRNMSADGMTFLYSGFAHAGSKCRLSLLTNNGSSATVHAVVSGCRYVENWMHEISVDFSAQVHAASFCPPRPEWSALVLVADDDEFRQVRHYLTALRAEVKRAENGGDIITQVGNDKFDCVLAELDPLGRSGIEAITKIRSSGYEGVILGIFDEGAPGKADEATSAGCTRCLDKPYGPELIKAVYEAVRAAASGR